MEWLGEIPAHWQVQPLKHLANFSTGGTPPTGREDLYRGEHLWANISDLGPRVLDKTANTISDLAIQEARLRIVEAGSLLFSFKLSIGTVSIAGVNMYTNEAIAAFTPSGLIDTGYLFWAAPILIPHNAQDNIYGAPLLNRERIANARLLHLLMSEQRAIAAFLDRETAKIDGLVERKERLIELLREKRIALITRAVTRGLDPNVPMKDSGVEWLGEIPAHWDVKRIKNVSAFVTSGSRGWADFYSDEGPCFLRIGNMQSGSIDLNIDKVQHVDPPPGSEGERTRVRPGDVLVSITALIGAVALVPENLPEAFVNQHIALIRPSASDVDSRWMAYCIMSPVGQTQFSADLYGGTKDGLELNDVRSLMVLAPPICEQERIVAYLDSHTKKLMNLVKAVQTAIDLLKEFRTALISAAVTGKIDVREEAA